MKVNWFRVCVSRVGKGGKDLSVQTVCGSLCSLNYSARRDGARSISGGWHRNCIWGEMHSIMHVMLGRSFAFFFFHFHAVIAAP